MANEQLTIQPNDARMTVIGKSWPDQASDSGGGDWDNTYNGTYSGPIPRTDLPVRIAVTTPPAKTEYEKNERIDFDGMVVTAYNEDGTVWTSEQYPDGTIPLNEIISTIPRPSNDYQVIKSGNVVCALIKTSAFTYTFERTYNLEYRSGRYTNRYDYSGFNRSILTSNNECYILILNPRRNESWSHQIQYIFFSKKAGKNCSEHFIAQCDYANNNGYDSKENETIDDSAIRSLAYSYTKDDKTVYIYSNFTGATYLPNINLTYQPDENTISYSDEQREVPAITIPYSSAGDDAILAWNILYGGDYKIINIATLYWQRPDDGKYLSTTFDVVIKDEKIDFGGN